MDKELIYRFFDGTASEMDKIQIRKWSEASPENMRELLNERKIYNAIVLTSNKKDYQNLKKKSSLKQLMFFRFCKYAAILVGAFVVSWFMDLLKDETLPMQEISVPVGQYIKMTLADGSEVYLNSGTKFTYPTKFSEKYRVVELDGEAFFDVEHTINDAPFIVKTSKGEVEVLGTQFNVEAYAQKKSFITSLLQGGVKVSSKNEELTLKPNECASLVDGKLVKSKLKDNTFYSWTSGMISFNNITFEALMQEFEKIYDITIIFNNQEIKESVCFGKFRRVDGLEYALNVLKVGLPFSYERDTEKPILYIN